jgi:hypothetical protein
MKKFLLLFIVASAFSYSAAAQTMFVTKVDTINSALLLRLANHTLTKNDSAILKQRSGRHLQITAPGSIDPDLLAKLINNTLSPAENALLIKQIMQGLKIDTIKVRFNRNGLLEPNYRLDSIDLKQPSCYFEKDANAMVIFDLGQMAVDATGLRVERHKRIKIFNEKGKDAANIHINYSDQFGAEQVEEIEGKTINMVDGKITYTELDTKSIYHENIDKYHESVVFSMPNVKAGSVIEIAYVLHRSAPKSIPGWDFQSDIPTRFSQYVVQLYRDVRFNSLDRTTLPLFKDSVIFNGYGHVWAMTDVPSKKTEPFMRSPIDGLQSINLTITSAMAPNGTFVNMNDSWATVGKILVNDKELEKTFDQNLNDKEGLAKTARKLATVDEKVKYLFNAVKTEMKWNGERNWASKDGIKKAWENKSGNWGEINMALCKLLNQAGVKAYPMMASTRDNGIMYHNFADIFQINKLVTYVPVNASHYYVLDASGKFNDFSTIPYDLLSSYGLYLDKDDDTYDMVLLKNEVPVKQEIIVNGDIKPDGTMTGSATIKSFSYLKTAALEAHEHLDEKKYMEALADNDNNLRILSLKLEDAEVDSLPLTQNLDFKLDLPGTDDNYIYFSPNLFSGLHNNPFISENRFSNIDFGCNYLLSINGKYKIPAGYKIDVLPKSQMIETSDKSISFTRDISEQNGYIVAHYTISYNRFFFSRGAYPEIHDYFKKMYELLNEQIVLKK